MFVDDFRSVTLNCVPKTTLKNGTTNTEQIVPGHSETSVSLWQNHGLLQIMFFLNKTKRICLVRFLDEGGTLNPVFCKVF